MEFGFLNQSTAIDQQAFSLEDEIHAGYGTDVYWEERRQWRIQDLLNSRGRIKGCEGNANRVEAKLPGGGSSGGVPRRSRTVLLI